ncbi:MAG TPA: prepilin-type N-terminal cleavage/methylation domain-containing protein [Candidatus Saccharimonadales bacterium]|nr:prepilin-type N-terminal cleavage/methylation domain-containing protein [Candidatus Saccharimonadales bacterium]
MHRIHNYLQSKLQKSWSGFTIVEILIVIVVIGILASIAMTTYNGTQNKAKVLHQQNDLKHVLELIEIYEAKHEEYPKTTDQSQANWRTIDVRTDDNCHNGSSQPDWVPDLNESLPQSDTSYGAGVDGVVGCYLYASNGEEYVISAWNMLSSPQTSTMYRRLGFREFQTSTSTQFYTCNSGPIGGANGGYDIAQDYYKHSYTISNITTCDETPPPGA